MKKLLITLILIFGFLTPVWAESYWTLKDAQVEIGKNEYITVSYIKRVSDKAVIPRNMDNKDYLQYLEDVKNGASVTPFDYAAEEVRQKEEQDKIKEKAKEKIDKVKEKLGLTDKEFAELKEALND